MKAGSIEIRIDYDENRHIIGFNVRDTQDTTLDVKMENKGVSVPNKGKNLKEELKSFCTSKKGTEDTKILKKFYEHYLNKLDTWKGDFRVEECWDIWKKREKK